MLSLRSNDLRPVEHVVGRTKMHARRVEITTQTSAVAAAAATALPNRMLC